MHDSDKRRFKRVPFREAVHYHIVNRIDSAPGPGRASGEEQYGGCLSLDLSEGGLRFQFSDFIPVNTELELGFVLPGAKAVKLCGKIVWAQKLPHAERYYVGMAFDASPENMFSQHSIRAAVDHRAGLPGHTAN